MNQYETIRAALEAAKTTARICVLPVLAQETSAALAALAELEKAASEPVAWRWERNREHGWVEHMSRYKVIGGGK